MSRLFSISIFLVISSLNCTSQNVANDWLVGEWMYQDVKWIKNKFNPSTKENCDYKNILTIISTNELKEFYFNEESYVGYLKGFSTNKVCMVDPETFEISIELATCGPQWILPSYSSSKFIRYTASGAVEYDIVSIGEDQIRLEIDKVLEDKGDTYPKYIELLRIKT